MQSIDTSRYVRDGLFSNSLLLQEFCPYYISDVDRTNISLSLDNSRQNAAPCDLDPPKNDDLGVQLPDVVPLKAAGGLRQYLVWHCTPHCKSFNCSNVDKEDPPDGHFEKIEHSAEKHGIAALCTTWRSNRHQDEFAKLQCFHRLELSKCAQLHRKFVDCFQKQADKYEESLDLLREILWQVLQYQIYEADYFVRKRQSLKENKKLTLLSLTWNIWQLVAFIQEPLCFAVKRRRNFVNWKELFQRWRTWYAHVLRMKWKESNISRYCSRTMQTGLQRFLKIWKEYSFHRTEIRFKHIDHMRLRILKLFWKAWNEDLRNKSCIDCMVTNFCKRHNRNVLKSALTGWISSKTFANFMRRSVERLKRRQRIKWQTSTLHSWHAICVVNLGICQRAERFCLNAFQMVYSHRVKETFRVWKESTRNTAFSLPRTDQLSGKKCIFHLRRTLASWRSRAHSRKRLKATEHRLVSRYCWELVQNALVCFQKVVSEGNRWKLQLYRWSTRQTRRRLQLSMVWMCWRGVVWLRYCKRTTFSAVHRRFCRMNSFFFAEWRSFVHRCFIRNSGLELLKKRSNGCLLTWSLYTWKVSLKMAACNRNRVLMAHYKRKGQRVKDTWMQWIKTLHIGKMRENVNFGYQICRLTAMKARIICRWNLRCIAERRLGQRFAVAHTRRIRQRMITALLLWRLSVMEPVPIYNTNLSDRLKSFEQETFRLWEREVQNSKRLAYSGLKMRQKNIRRLMRQNLQHLYTIALNLRRQKQFISRRLHKFSISRGWGHWWKVTSLHRKTKNTLSYAKMLRQKKLISLFHKLWKEHLERMGDVVAGFVRRSQLTYLAVRWHLWFEFVIKSRKFAALQATRKGAVKIFVSRLETDTFLSWAALLENNAQATARIQKLKYHQKIRLISRILTIWQQTSALRRQARRRCAIIASRQSRRVLALTMRQWNQGILTLIAQRNRSSARRVTQSRSKAFASWHSDSRRRVMRAISKRRAHERFCSSFLRHAFGRIWAYRGLRRWKRRKLATSIAVDERHRKRRVWILWIRETRAKRARKVIFMKASCLTQRCLIQAAIRRWRRGTAERRTKLHFVKAARSRKSGRVLSIGFVAWHPDASSLQREEEQPVWVCPVYQRNVVKGIFDAWRQICTLQLALCVTMKRELKSQIRAKTRFAWNGWKRARLVNRRLKHYEALCIQRHCKLRLRNAIISWVRLSSAKSLLERLLHPCLMPIQRTLASRSLVLWHFELLRAGTVKALALKMLKQYCKWLTCWVFTNYKLHCQRRSRSRKILQHRSSFQRWQCMSKLWKGWENTVSCSRQRSSLLCHVATAMRPLTRVPLISDANTIDAAPRGMAGGEAVPGCLDKDLLSRACIAWHGYHHQAAWLKQRAETTILRGRMRLRCHVWSSWRKILSTGNARFHKIAQWRYRRLIALKGLVWKCFEITRSAHRRAEIVRSLMSASQRRHGFRTCVRIWKEEVRQRKYCDALIDRCQAHTRRRTMVSWEDWRWQRKSLRRVLSSLSRRSSFQALRTSMLQWQVVLFQWRRERKSLENFFVLQKGRSVRWAFGFLQDFTHMRCRTRTVVQRHLLRRSCLVVDNVIMSWEHHTRLKSFQHRRISRLEMWLTHHVISRLLLAWYSRVNHSRTITRSTERICRNNLRGLQSKFWELWQSRFQSWACKLLYLKRGHMNGSKVRAMTMWQHTSALRRQARRRCAIIASRQSRRVLALAMGNWNQGISASIVHGARRVTQSRSSMISKAFASWHSDSRRRVMRAISKRRAHERFCSSFLRHAFGRIWAYRGLRRWKRRKLATSIAVDERHRKRSVWILWIRETRAKRARKVIFMKASCLTQRCLIQAAIRRWRRGTAKLHFVKAARSRICNMIAPLCHVFDKWHHSVVARNIARQRFEQHNEIQLQAVFTAWHRPTSRKKLNYGIPNDVLALLKRRFKRRIVLAWRLMAIRCKNGRQFRDHSISRRETELFRLGWASFRSNVALQRKKKRLFRLWSMHIVEIRKSSMIRLWKKFLQIERFECFSLVHKVSRLLVQMVINDCRFNCQAQFLGFKSKWFCTISSVFQVWKARFCRFLCFQQRTSFASRRRIVKICRFLYSNWSKYVEQRKNASLQAKAKERGRSCLFQWMAFKSWATAVTTKKFMLRMLRTVEACKHQISLSATFSMWDNRICVAGHENGVVRFLIRAACRKYCGLWKHYVVKKKDYRSVDAKLILLRDRKVIRHVLKAFGNAVKISTQLYLVMKGRILLRKMMKPFLWWKELAHLSHQVSFRVSQIQDRFRTRNNCAVLCKWRMHANCKTLSSTKAELAHWVHRARNLLISWAWDTWINNNRHHKRTNITLQSLIRRSQFTQVDRLLFGWWYNCKIQRTTQSKACQFHKKVYSSVRRIIWAWKQLCVNRGNIGLLWMAKCFATRFRISMFAKHRALQTATIHHANQRCVVNWLISLFDNNRIALPFRAWKEIKSENSTMRMVEGKVRQRIISNLQRIALIRLFQNSEFESVCKRHRKSIARFGSLTNFERIRVYIAIRMLRRVLEIWCVFGSNQRIMISNLYRMSIKQKMQQQAAFFISWKRSSIFSENFTKSFAVVKWMVDVKQRLYSHLLCKVVPSFFASWRHRFLLLKALLYFKKRRQSARMNKIFCVLKVIGSQNNGRSLTFHLKVVASSYLTVYIKPMVEKWRVSTILARRNRFVEIKIRRLRLRSTLSLALTTWKGFAFLWPKQLWNINDETNLKNMATIWRQLRKSFQQWQILACDSSNHHRAAIHARAKLLSSLLSYSFNCLQQHAGNRNFISCQVQRRVIRHQHRILVCIVLSWHWVVRRQRPSQVEYVIVLRRRLQTTRLLGLWSGYALNEQKRRDLLLEFSSRFVKLMNVKNDALEHAQNGIFRAWKRLILIQRSVQLGSDILLRLRSRRFYLWKMGIVRNALQLSSKRARRVGIVYSIGSSGLDCDFSDIRSTRRAMKIWKSFLHVGIKRDQITRTVSNNIIVQFIGDFGQKVSLFTKLHRWWRLSILRNSQKTILEKLCVRRKRQLCRQALRSLQRLMVQMRQQDITSRHVNIWRLYKSWNEYSREKRLLLSVFKKCVTRARIASIAKAWKLLEYYLLQRKRNYDLHERITSRRRETLLMALWSFWSSKCCTQQTLLLFGYNIHARRQSHRQCLRIFQIWKRLITDIQKSALFSVSMINVKKYNSIMQLKLNICTTVFASSISGTSSLHVLAILRHIVEIWRDHSENSRIRRLRTLKVAGIIGYKAKLRIFNHFRLEFQCHLGKVLILRRLVLMKVFIAWNLQLCGQQDRHIFIVKCQATKKHFSLVRYLELWKDANRHHLMFSKIMLQKEQMLHLRLLAFSLKKWQRYVLNHRAVSRCKCLIQKKRKKNLGFIWSAWVVCYISYSGSTLLSQEIRVQRARLRTSIVIQTWKRTVSITFRIICMRCRMVMRQGRRKILFLQSWCGYSKKCRQIELSLFAFISRRNISSVLSFWSRWKWWYRLASKLRSAATRVLTNAFGMPSPRQFLHSLFLAFASAVTGREIKARQLQFEHSTSTCQSENYWDDQKAIKRRFHMDSRNILEKWNSHALHTFTMSGILAYLFEQMQRIIRILWDIWCQAAESKRSRKRLGAAIRFQQSKKFRAVVLEVWKLQLYQKGKAQNLRISRMMTRNANFLRLPFKLWALLPLNELHKQASARLTLKRNTCISKSFVFWKCTLKHSTMNKYFVIGRVAASDHMLLYRHFRKFDIHAIDRKEARKSCLSLKALDRSRRTLTRWKRWMTSLHNMKFAYVTIQRQIRLFSSKFGIQCWKRWHLFYTSQQHRVASLVLRRVPKTKKLFFGGWYYFILDHRRIKRLLLDLSSRKDAQLKVFCWAAWNIFAILHRPLYHRTGSSSFLLQEATEDSATDMTSRHKSAKTLFDLQSGASLVNPKSKGCLWLALTLWRRKIKNCRSSAETLLLMMSSNSPRRKIMRLANANIRSTTATRYLHM